jgi:hypothetical protein
MSKDKLTASEAVYGFCGWITTRSVAVTAGDTHDCAAWANLVKEFCEANDLNEPADGWHENLVHPSDEPVT